MHMSPRSIAAIAAVTVFSIGSANAQLAAVGPVNPQHGFPAYYRGTDNLQLAPCLGDANLCLLDNAADLLHPELPFPLNYGGVFPTHVFYNAAEATLTTNGGGLGLLVMALQGGFANDDELPVPGEQFVLARLRLRIDNLVPGATYHITTPYGVFDEVATQAGRRGINMTIDIPGIVIGAFDAARSGPIGPTFLRWDSDLPIVDGAGNNYVGNPAIEHTITGSPYGTNYFRIEGPNVGGLGINVLHTDLFSVIGMIDPGAPVADLAASPTSGPAPLSVQFNDMSAGDVTSWAWDFGDGATSTAQNPTHVYTEPGTYTVSLVASGPGGSNQRVIGSLIDVQEPPLVLHAPTPGIGGVANDFLVTGATPGREVYLFMSPELGGAPVKIRNCNELTGLQSPTLLARARATSRDVTLRVKMSRAVLGRTMHLQVLDLGGCELSNVVSEPF